MHVGGGKKPTESTEYDSVNANDRGIYDFTRTEQKCVHGQDYDVCVGRNDGDMMARRIEDGK